ncbi:hypothetical protein PO909_001393 [Leuciscus waleckii]
MDLKEGCGSENDLYHAGELLSLLDVHLQIPEPHLTEPHVLAFLTEKSNFTNYRPKSFSMREFSERVGHDLKEMMLYCRFQGQECSYQDFKTVCKEMILILADGVVLDAKLWCEL